MTLTYKLYLDILPLDLHTQIQVRMPVRLALKVVTDRQTHTHRDGVKTITPDTSQTWGVIICISSIISKVLGEKLVQMLL